MQSIGIFELPPASAGGVGMNVALALATNYVVLAKATLNIKILSLQLKLNVIKFSIRLRQFECFIKKCGSFF